MNSQNEFFKSVGIVAGITIFILLILFLVMQFTNGMKWSLFDFILAGILIFGTGFTYKLITMKKDNLVYRAAIGLSLLTVFILIWGNLAVGIIGAEDNPANLVYIVVLAVGIIGASIARLKPQGMSIVLFLVAAAQAIIAIVVFISAILRQVEFTIPKVMTFIMLHGFFVALWTGSALLFRHAARK